MTPEASAVKAEYVKQRQMLQPRYSGSSERWTKCWQRCAEFIEGNNLDLERFMAAQFALKKPFPMPNHLYSPAALERYEAHRTDYDPREEALRRVEVELHFVETRSRLGLGLAEILHFPGAPLTALFCYRFARSMGQVRLAERFRDRAEQQAAASKDAAEVYALMFPEGVDGAT